MSFRAFFYYYSSPIGKITSPINLYPLIDSFLTGLGVVWLGVGFTRCCEPIYSFMTTLLTLHFWEAQPQWWVEIRLRINT